jgi:hypothetical protein
VKKQVQTAKKSKFRILTMVVRAESRVQLRLVGGGWRGVHGGEQGCCMAGNACARHQTPLRPTWLMRLVMRFVCLDRSPLSDKARALGRKMKSVNNDENKIRTTTPFFET